LVIFIVINVTCFKAKVCSLRSQRFG